MIKLLRLFFAIAALGLASPAAAQWQVPNHSVPTGRGAGVTGFGNATPSTPGQPLVSNGAGTDPTFQPLPCQGLVGGVDCNLLHTALANYTLAPNDCGATVQLGTGATGFFTLTVPPLTGFSSICSVVVVNSDTGRGKAISGVPGISMRGRCRQRP